LILGTNGDLYGATLQGGANSAACQYGPCGTIFKITPGGALTTLYSFCSQTSCTDGNYPNGLVQATNGDLYGTTAYGGAYNSGTVFRLTSGGAFTTLHRLLLRKRLHGRPFPFHGVDPV
jgi:uncharacterized repeat protein (TIGR03803 family)